MSRPVVNIADLRGRARLRLPRAIFDYIDGGAEDEVTLRENMRAFERVSFVPRMLVDATTRDMSTTVLGQKIDVPIILAPCGMPGIFWPNGEVLAARAAARFGTIFSLSTLSFASLEDVAAATNGPLWFQLYVFRDRELSRSIVERALKAGYQALLLTVDVQVAGARERDVYNGFTIPPRITASNVLDSIWRVGWIRGVLRGPPLTFRNVAPESSGARDAVPLAGYVNRQFDPGLTWADVDWLRSLWPRHLIIKGIMTAEDARLAAEHGADGIIVSNHGGRQLDSASSSIEVLPEIVRAVGDRLEVLLDSGVRRGSDVAKAIALGARAVLVGRAYLYGLAYAGGPGVETALGILTRELDRTLTLLGRPSIADLEPSAVQLRPAATSGTLRA
jgi:isopentenyl diphosphate isomerase/L-lactate dehydrogenase-like FMN-dependent dehydrogenase